MSSRRGPILLAVVLGSGIVFLDGTIVNVALETIGRELPASLVGRLEGLTYVASGYLAVLAALLVLAGRSPTAWAGAASSGWACSDSGSPPRSAGWPRQWRC